MTSRAQRRAFLYAAGMTSFFALLDWWGSSDNWSAYWGHNRLLLLGLLLCTSFALLLLEDLEALHREILWLSEQLAGDKPVAARARAWRLEGH